MAHNRYIPSSPALDDRRLAKALTMMIDEYASQNYGCAWCAKVGPTSSHAEDCPITIARTAIKILKTRESVPS